jgi:hypothetical protein
MSETEYYAVPDPAGDAITYWRRNRRGGIDPWPTRARYGPRLLTRDVPRRLTGRARREWVNTWYATVHAPWHDAISAAITTDPDTARARFAAFTSRCCWCGRHLTDNASKVYGIGPDCRHGLPAELLADMARAVGRLHAQTLHAQPERTTP